MTKPTRRVVGLVVLAGAMVCMGTPAYAAYPAIYADGVLAYTNAQRYQEGLPFYASNVTLSKIAAVKLQDLFANQYFAHESPSGKTIGDLADEYGYGYIAVGENLALGGFTSSKDVVDAWMKSPGHRANILSPSFTEIGIAAGRGMYKGAMEWIVVQEFGLPQSVCPQPDESLKQTLTSEHSVLDLLETIARLRETALGRASKSDPDYASLVASYNLAAKLYNDRAASYRTIVTKYNATVEAFNACVKADTADIPTIEE